VLCHPVMSRSSEPVSFPKAMLLPSPGTFGLSSRTRAQCAALNVLVEAARPGGPAIVIDEGAFLAELASRQQNRTADLYGLHCLAAWAEYHDLCCIPDFEVLDLCYRGFFYCQQCHIQRSTVQLLTAILEEEGSRSHKMPGQKITKI
jgi:hypothetical protein